MALGRTILPRSLEKPCDFVPIQQQQRRISRSVSNVQYTAEEHFLAQELANFLFSVYLSQENFPSSTPTHSRGLHFRRPSHYNSEGGGNKFLFKWVAIFHSTAEKKCPSLSGLRRKGKKGEGRGISEILVCSKQVGWMSKVLDRYLQLPKLVHSNSGVQTQNT